MLSEVTQGLDGVHATRMLPSIMGTDLGSLKQKENLLAGCGGLGLKGGCKDRCGGQPGMEAAQRAKNHEAQQPSCSRTTLA